MELCEGVHKGFNNNVQIMVSDLQIGLNRNLHSETSSCAQTTAPITPMQKDPVQAQTQSGKISDAQLLQSKAQLLPNNA